ncbi:phosphoadenosine phosphosulfate reductase [Rhodobacter sp. NSM]|uniref:phosphoadenosine phosphosulfate reductase n=1 Tax=Rhodobacter sp. NSM TaxID=3457501 RepID=UPI003FD20FB2
MTCDLTPDPRLLGPAVGAVDSAGLLRNLEAIGEEVGDFQPLGSRHWAFFRDDGPVLIVSFERLEDIRAHGPAGLPVGDAVARARGWSHLCLIADGDTWFRDTALYRYFDRLVDDAFFEDFDRVVFHGEGMGAYAACAFSPTAPEATVLAISARATLDPDRAGWDPRDRTARRLAFSGRYGYAPDMIEGTGRVFLLHDPAETLDAMHAALFRGDHVHPVRMRNAGAPLGQALRQMDLLVPLIEAAAAGSLSPLHAARLWRARRESSAYLIHLLALNARRPRRAQKLLSAAERILGPQVLRAGLMDLRSKLKKAS